MTKWLSSQEIMERLDIKDFELLDYLKRGLQPYNKLRKRVGPPEIQEKLDRLERWERELEDLKRSYESPPEETTVMVGLKKTERKKEILSTCRHQVGIRCCFGTRSMR